MKGRKRGHNEGSWSTRGDGRLEYKVTIDGRRRSFYGQTKKAVVEKYEAFKLAESQGLDVKGASNRSPNFSRTG